MPADPAPRDDTAAAIRRALKILSDRARRGEIVSLTCLAVTDDGRATVVLMGDVSADAHRSALDLMAEEIDENDAAAVTCAGGDA